MDGGVARDLGNVQHVDTHLGRRVFERRQALGRSQNGLAKELGVSTPQLRKYENGANRISAETLHKLATILDVEVGFFYEGLPGVEAYSLPTLSDETTLNQAASLEAIPDEETRRSLLTLIDRVTPSLGATSTVEPA